MVRVAIMIDGGFYLKRIRQLRRGIQTPEEAAEFLIRYCNKHLEPIDRGETVSLYKIFYYDCLPSDKIVMNPFTGEEEDLGQSEQHTWVLKFLEELKTKRKMTLRLGVLSDQETCYVFKPAAVYDIVRSLQAKKRPKIQETDLTLNIKQKGVDMKLGIDIASVAYKKQVDRIILIAGDSDFVPAAKLARREGIDFILDPLWNNVKPDLFEHIDDMITCQALLPKPKAKANNRNTNGVLHINT